MTCLDRETFNSFPELDSEVKELIHFSLMRPHVVEAAREWVAEGFPDINPNDYSDEEIIFGVNDEFGIEDFLYQYGFVEQDEEGALYEVETILR
ncbi:MAG: hypothetical protein F6K21_03255 [Symploca sp. SIO2D2]|nr:hypothetical protein [Symploca sp. SIO2D2]